MPYGAIVFVTIVQDKFSKILTKKKNHKFHFFLKCQNGPQLLTKMKKMFCYSFRLPKMVIQSFIPAEMLKWSTFLPKKVQKSSFQPTRRVKQLSVEQLFLRFKWLHYFSSSYRVVNVVSLWSQENDQPLYQENKIGPFLLRPVKWVTLWWFLFGVHPYQLTLDFALFIL